MPQTIAPGVISWAPLDELEPDAVAQAARTAAMPFVHGHVALMPDAHVGKGSTIGSVIPTRGAIMPAAVGVDIGCGMIAAQTGLPATALPDDLGGLLARVERAIPAGVGKGHDDGRPGPTAQEMFGVLQPATDLDGAGLLATASRQFATLGSGNHFVEVCLDTDDGVWVVLHSGSRGVGNKLAVRHIEQAKGLMARYFVDLPDPDLAYLVEGTPEFDAYIADMLWAQAYALGSRAKMMDAALAELAQAVGRTFAPTMVVNTHHNFTVREHHMGTDVWVTRKGAVRAREGDLGVIPGSMGTSTFVVRGLGNPASYCSSAHGAGRRMSRGAARRTLTAASLAEAMTGKTWLADRADDLLDEHPDAYKDVRTVMAQQADLVGVVAELRQVLNYKGAN